MKNLILSELMKIKTDLIDGSLKEIFIQQSQNKMPLIRKYNPAEHFCTFILPFDSKTGQVYMVHHIKANLWVPPGGHIEENENPVDTLVREYKEELGTEVNPRQINFFNLTVTRIDEKNIPCKVHYDFWYLVYTPVVNFRYEKKEFHSARWTSLESAITITESKSVKSSLNKLKRIVNRL